jgi:hypothetical protein
MVAVIALDMRKQSPPIADASIVIGLSSTQAPILHETMQ